MLIGIGRDLIGNKNKCTTKFGTHKEAIERIGI